MMAEEPLERTRPASPRGRGDEVADLLRRIDDGAWNLRHLASPTNSDGKEGKPLQRVGSVASTMSCSSSDFTGSLASPTSSLFSPARPGFAHEDAASSRGHSRQLSVDTSSLAGIEEAGGSSPHKADLAQLAGSSASLALAPSAPPDANPTLRPAGGLAAELRDLTQLYLSGALSDGEYAAAKSQVLGTPPGTPTGAVARDAPALPVSPQSARASLVTSASAQAMRTRDVHPRRRSKQAWTGRGIYASSSSTHLFTAQPKEQLDPNPSPGHARSELASRSEMERTEAGGSHATLSFSQATLSFGYPGHSSVPPPSPVLLASLREAGVLRPTAWDGATFGRRASMIDVARRLSQPNFRSCTPRWGTADGRHSWLLANEGATYNQNPASGLTRVGPADYVSHKDNKGAMWGMSGRSHTLWHAG